MQPPGVYPMKFHAETISVALGNPEFSVFKPVTSGRPGRRAGCFYLNPPAVGMSAMALIAVSVEWSPWARSYLVTEHHPVTHADERYTFVRNFRQAVQFGRYRAEQRGGFVKRGILALDGVVAPRQRNSLYFRPKRAVRGSALH
jgi:hypothetical protein